MSDMLSACRRDPPTLRFIGAWVSGNLDDKLKRVGHADLKLKSIFNYSILGSTLGILKVPPR
jgi:hypothetical protein